jgi:acyl-[acyl-carrier-protein]-phospholipid O-acyltransferase/long-chain-fatty-acid--[acyl-carrier-protein] ligase
MDILRLLLVGILIGSLSGGLYNSFGYLGIMLATAALGFVSSLFIPKSNNFAPDMKINFNLLDETKNIMEYSYSKKHIFLCILGISWFWFIGAAFLAEIPMLSKNIFGANESVANLFLAIFSIGVGIGSFWCSKVFSNEVTAKYVPIAAIGISLWF